MTKPIKILILIVTALVLGFLFGVYNTHPTVEVYDAAGNLVTTSVDQASSGVFFPGLKMESVPWYISRSSAIAAYILLFAVVIWGIGMTFGLTYKFIEPARAWQLHKEMSISFAVLVAVHAFALLFDRFIGFKVLDVLLPFYSDFKPLFLSFGIIGFYLLLAIIFSSIFIRLSSPRLWRMTHYFSYPLFVLATIHGFMIGTDSKTVLMQGLYIFASAVFAGLFLYRFAIYPFLRKRA
jgi:DMSO/TMAO reductase YedYZ heme-binding membrane subunit